MPKYNLRFRAIDFQFSTGLQAAFNDNVTLSGNDPISDLIITPTATIRAFWQITPFNSLHLDTTIGYRWYVNHPEVIDSGSPLLIASDSAIEYNIFIGAFTINLHDRFSAGQDPVSEPSVSNTASLDFFTNTLGILGTWKASSVSNFRLGYDHSDRISSGSAFDDSSYTQDQLTASGSVELASMITGGLEGSLASTRYTQSDRSDVVSTSFGPFFDVELTHFTKVRVAGGYQVASFSGGNTSSTAFISPDSPFVTAPEAVEGTHGTFYYNAELNNQLTHRIHQNVAIGRESSLGISAASSQDDYARYHLDWSVNDHAKVRAGIDFDRGTSSGSTEDERYSLFSVDIGGKYAFSPRLSTSLTYRFTKRYSNIPEAAYTQNLVSVTVEYHF